MKILIAFLITLVIAVSAGLWAIEDPGYILISFDKWAVETTLALACIAVVISFAAFYYSIRFIAGLRRVPGGVRHWSQERHERKAERVMTKGMIELAEGQWTAAERHVAKYAADGHTPLLNYLAAARAAQAQGAESRRDNYLKLAHENNPDADIAIGLTQAELQLEQQQKEQALATLRHLQQLAPKHPQVLKSLANLYQELEDWNQLLELLPSLRKHKVFSTRQLDDLACRAYLALIAVAQGSELRDIWSRISKPLRENEQILVTYVERLIVIGDSDLAEPLVRHALQHGINEELVKLYGEIEGANPAQQLATAEALLSRYEGNAVALLTAGRLSLRNKLWGKAQSYLETSIRVHPSAEACNELGNLLDHMGEHDAALKCYRAGLRLVPGCEHPVAIAMPVSIEATERLAVVENPLVDATSSDETENLADKEPLR